MDTLQQAELNAKQKAKLAEEAGWNPRIAPRDTSPDGSTAWRAEWPGKRIQSDIFKGMK
ncbi:MAG: hypothetical protein WAO89_04520 [Kiritimatiellia bacterium]